MGKCCRGGWVFVPIQPGPVDVLCAGAGRAKSARPGLPVVLGHIFGLRRIAHVVGRHDLDPMFVEYILDIAM